MSELANPFTGLFSTTADVPRRPHDPAVYCWAGTLPRWGSAETELAVGGAGWTPELARLAGIGEAVERWRCRPDPDDGLVESTYGGWQLDEQTLEPNRWVLFAPEQYSSEGFPFSPFGASSTTSWIACRELRTGEAMWAPADFVFLESAGGGHSFGPTISTGLSAGRRSDPVVLRGLQEVIERDALVGGWWGSYPVREVSFEGVLGLLERRIRDAILRPNLHYRGYQIESPFSGNVTMVSLSGDDEVGFCFSVGSACRETRAASWEKAILEAIQGRHLVRHLLETGYDHLFVDGMPVDFQGHALYFSLFRARLDETVFETCESESVEPGGREMVGDLLGRLGSRAALVRNVTPRAITSAGLDWLVVRVLVPGLQPLHGHHGFPFLGGPLWGSRGLADWGSMLPHPFA